MKRSYQKWCEFRADQSGQDTIEYALVVALIAFGAIASMKTLSNTITQFWNQYLAKMATVYPW